MIPALLAWKTRRQGRAGRFVTPGGNLLIIVTLIFGIAVAAFHFLHMFGKLPAFSG